MDGWYYLHTNGDLIYKQDLDGIDLRESDFVRGMWPMDPSDRETAWRILIEASACGARTTRIDELAAKWGCDDVDALIYANRVGIKLFKDGSDWCATKLTFINLQESPSGHGATCLLALTDLCNQLGFRLSKMWGATFHDLVKSDGI